MRRQGSAIEILLASALLAVTILYMTTMVQGARKVAHLDELHVLAQRRAQRAVALLEGSPLESLLANPGGPPPIADPALSEKSREIFLPLVEDETLRELPAGVLDHYLRGSGSMPVRAFLEEIRPGFARLAVLVSWVEPSTRTPRHLVWVQYLEDPFRWRAP